MGTRVIVIPLDQLQEIFRELTMRAMHAEAEAHAELPSDEFTHCQAVQEEMEARVQDTKYEDTPMGRLHIMAEAHALAHPTPTVEVELRWASEQFVTGELHKAAWGGAVQVFDSCTVELDGCCEHGYKSPLILLGLI